MVVTLTGVPLSSAIGTSSPCSATQHSGPLESTSSTPLSVHVDNTITIIKSLEVQDRSPAEDVVKSVDSCCFATTHK